MRNRIAIACLAFATLLSGAAMAQDKTLRFSWWGGDDRHAATLKAIQIYEARHPGIKIKAEYAGWTGYLERLSTQIAGGSEPDIMQIDRAWIPVFSRGGDGFYDLNRVKAQLNLADFDQPDIDVVTRNGKLNGLPMGFTATIFAYNKTEWQKVGLPYPKTWDDLIAAGAVFKDKLGPDHYPLDVGRGLYLMQQWAAQKFGKTFFKPDVPEFSISRPELIATLDAYKRLADSRAIVPLPVRIAYGGADQQPEQMPAWSNGLWAGSQTWDGTIERRAAILPDKFEQVEVGPTFLLPGATSSGALGRTSMVFAVSKRAKDPEEAAKFLSFLLTDAEAAEVLGMTRGVPAARTAWAVVQKQGRISPLMSAALAEVRALRAKNLVPEASPYFENPQILNVLNGAFERFAYDKVTAEQAADEIIAGCGKILAKLQ